MLLDIEDHSRLEEAKVGAVQEGHTERDRCAWVVYEAPHRLPQVCAVVLGFREDWRRDFGGFARSHRRRMREWDDDFLYRWAVRGRIVGCGEASDGDTSLDPHQGRLLLDNQEAEDDVDD